MATTLEPPTTPVAAAAPVIPVCGMCQGKRYLQSTYNMRDSRQCWSCKGTGLGTPIVMAPPPPPKVAPPTGPVPLSASQPPLDPADPSKLAIPDVPPPLAWTLIPEKYGRSGPKGDNISATKKYLYGIMSTYKSFELPTPEELALWYNYECQRRDNERLKDENARMKEQVASLTKLLDVPEVAPAQLTNPVA
jgi:hypothetical protein